MNEYTPPTEEVQLAAETSAVIGWRVPKDVFYRWLAEHDREVKSQAWEEGHAQGWKDSQDAHEVRQEYSRDDWTSNIHNPYEEGS